LHAHIWEASLLDSMGQVCEVRETMHKEDVRVSNNDLHAYYVTAALLHCCCITECAESIGEIPETVAS